MCALDRGRSPSTPEATAAVAQSSAPAEPRADAGVEDACPDLNVRFRLGDGVGRAVRTRPYERKRNDPLYRPLRIFTLDPTASRLEGAVATVNVPYEPLAPGPRGQLVEVDVIVQSGAEGEREVRVRLDCPKVLLQNGRTPSDSDFEFHQQMVYAIASTVYAAFQKALGRHPAWAFGADADGQQCTRLFLRPHAFKGANAHYDRAHGEIGFGYYRSAEKVRGRNPPFGSVFTCLSHDIIAHEVAHALLDGLRSHFTHPSDVDVMSFHEAFADLVAIFQHFSYEEVVLAEVRKWAGRLHDSRLLGSIAQQFGDTTGRAQALRSAIDELDDAGMPRRIYDRTAEPHALGGVLVAALFEAFTTLFERKTARYIRLATNGTGRLPPGDIPADLQSVLAEEASRLASQFLSICIRAIDYCPPIDPTLGEYLRALITADHDLVPDDKWGYREALIDAFWRREIYPANVESLSEDALLWRPPRKKLSPVKALTFAELRFDGDPGRPAGAAELRRQACALGRLAADPDYMEEFGLAPKGHPDLNGDHVDLPCVESIRSARRVGPDGQIVFDLVAEVTQARTTRSLDGRTTLTYYGGATVIVGPDGEIRYVISKSVRDKQRLLRQQQYIDKQGRPFWSEQRVAGHLEPRPELFQLLHGGSGIGALETNSGDGLEEGSPAAR
jgi:hypothetical protein